MVIVELQCFQLCSSTMCEANPPEGPWILAVVPGGVHESLQAAGTIGHPFFADNEHAVRWVEDRTWWYRCSFQAPDVRPGQRAELRFACIDTVADVRLNGRDLGSVRNQHQPHTFDVTDFLSPDNELLLRFPPPLEGLLDPTAEEAAVEATRSRQRAVRPAAAELPRDQLLLPALRSQLRKATFSWGWDFAARVPSIGLVGDVTLRVSSAAILSDLYVRTTSLDVESRTATLTVTAKAPASGTVRICVMSPSGRAVQALTPAADLVYVEIELTDVEPWWTHDLGAQPLYNVTASLVDADPLSSISTQVGIRTIELDRSEDDLQPGRLFRFLLNGIPLFARGANWVPPSLLLGSIPTTTRDHLVDLARKANMNMLRVWGGGVYEPDGFYDACDRAGLLVWQDFMFACFDYPTEGTGLEEHISREAQYQVSRLRNHPCLALWCGNNEVQGIHELTHGTLEPGNWGWSVFHQLLPAVVSELDPSTTYWPGSPWGETTSEIVNGISDGDRHAWEVWHGVDVGAGGPTDFASRGDAVHFHRYEHDFGRFISEFGIHASPELATLARWTLPGSLSLGSAAFDQRQKDTPKDKGFALMERETGLPANLEQYVDFSMACQAEGLKHGVEHYRRRQPHCSGTLVWQLNDSWPGLSWSVIDYDLVPKAGYWFLQRAYAPAILSFRRTGSGLELWLTNSGAINAAMELTASLRQFDGTVVREVDLTVEAPRDSSRVVWSCRELPGPDTYAWVSAPGGLWNRCFFAPLKDLPISDAPLQAQIVESREGSTTIELHAPSYAYLARLHSSEPGALFSANYLDMPAGSRAQIEVTGVSATARLAVASYGHPAVLI